MNNDYEEVHRLIKEANYFVFFGGAGVSTESGIPDFRSKDGLYNKPDINFSAYSPEYLLSHTCLYQDTDIFYEFYRQKMDTRNILPNQAHVLLAKWEKEGYLKTVITQNIDGLHQEAGSSHVLEIHGTTKKNYCDTCFKNYPSDYLFKHSNYKCTCGGLIRPDVTLYEEALPNSFMEAVNEVKKADVLMVGGTSLSVYPASSLLNYFKGTLILINKDQVTKQVIPDYYFKDSISKVLIEIDKAA